MNTVSIYTLRLTMAANKEIALAENAAAYKRFWFRPRVYVQSWKHVHSLNSLIARLNKISKVSTATSMLSMPCSLPIFIAPAALARLGHPDGEMNLVRAAAATGILQGVGSHIRRRRLTVLTDS